MTIFYWILMLLLSFLGLRYFLLLNGLKEMRLQLKVFTEDSHTNQLLTDSHHLKELQELIIQTNQVLVQKEERLRQLQIRDQTTKEQMTNASHDLRTPLASILGYFELLEDETLPPSEKQEYLDMIKKRAKLLKSLLDNYYELSKLESETFLLEMKGIDLEAALSEVLAAFYPDFVRKSIVLDIAPATRRLNIMGDEQTLERILVNLIQNVLQHGSQSCSLFHTIQENGVIITTISNRVLQPEKIEIDKVFNRLYSVDRTRSFGNTGIGLTIAKLLLEKIGHSLEAALEDDQFIITIKWTSANI